MLAKGTPWWIAVPPALVALAGAWIALGGRILAWVVLLLALALTALLLNFFRDPERRAADGIAACADGVVTEIGEKDGRMRIVTFMNPLNVHVNRVPADSVVRRREHVPGGFIPAFNKESDANERMIWDLETPYGEIRVVQIAGTVARRIVPYVDAGARLAKGERFGMIRLGSRVDVYLPPGATPAVKIGDKVRAGETTLATVGAK